MAKLHLLESKHDTEIAEKLVGMLEKLGHAVSWDMNYLVPGMEWKRSLKDAVANCDGLVALFTKNCVTDSVVSSQWIAADIGAAKAYGKFIIPVILGNDVSIPGLVGDIFTIIEPDETRLKEVAQSVSDAVKVHMTKKAAESELNIPPGYQHLASALLQFDKDYPYDKSVFVMMKFPDKATLNPQQCELLEDIWQELGRVLSVYGLTPRRADKNSYHDQMWENMCVYMLGCRYGIAILEDFAAAELNPNVALEYGFMKANNKNVVLLRDINFKHDRADIIGKIAKSFEIKDGKLDKAKFTQAIQQWCVDEKIPQIANL